MAIESAPYYFAKCDGCGEVCDYGDYSAWKDADTAADQAVALDWTEKDGVFHCPDCPPLGLDDEGDDAGNELVASGDPKSALCPEVSTAGTLCARLPGHPLPHRDAIGSTWGDGIRRDGITIGDEAEGEADRG